MDSVPCSYLELSYITISLNGLFVLTFSWVASMPCLWNVMFAHIVICHEAQKSAKRAFVASSWRITRWKFKFKNFWPMMARNDNNWISNRKRLQSTNYPSINRKIEKQPIQHILAVVGDTPQNWIERNEAPIASDFHLQVVSPIMNTNSEE